jgi:hypothetical protein
VLRFFNEKFIGSNELAIGWEHHGLGIPGSQVMREVSADPISQTQDHSGR